MLPRLPRLLAAALAFACVASLAPAPLFAQDEDRALNNVVVTRASVDASNRITLSGENFLGSNGRRTVSVYLERSRLTLVGSPTQTKVVAQLPANLAAGTYMIVVADGPGANMIDSFEITIGASGPAGAQGAMGPQGPAGPAGPAGSAGPAGAAGAIGAVGPVGPAGAQGVVGPVGPAGAQGAVGPVGPVGALGPIGPVGPAGAVGPIGPIGLQGIQGLQGFPGLSGAIGPAGPIGPMGPVGPKGDKGDPGDCCPEVTTVFQNQPFAIGSFGSYPPPTIPFFVSPVPTVIMGTSVTVPANTKVYISTDGGIMTRSPFANGVSRVGLGLFIDGAPVPNAGARKLTAANTAGVAGNTAYYSMSLSTTLSAGTHLIEVRVTGLGGDAAAIGGGFDPATGNLVFSSDMQGQLTVMTIRP